MLPDSTSIILTGHILPGHERERVIVALAKLLNTTEEKATELLSGKQTVVKRNVLTSESKRYLQALSQIGAEVRVKPGALENEKTPTSPPPTMSMAPARTSRRTKTIAGVILGVVFLGVVLIYGGDIIGAYQGASSRAQNKAALAPKEDKKKTTPISIADYFPLKLGSEYVYEEGLKSGEKSVETNHYRIRALELSDERTVYYYADIKASSLKIRPVFEFGTFWYDQGSLQTIHASSPQSVRRVSSLQTQKLLPATMILGTSSTQKTDLHEITLTYVAQEDVEVPAGKFPNCLKFEVVAKTKDEFRKILGGGHRYEVWLAREVGVVKWTWSYSGRTEFLVKYSPSNKGDAAPEDQGDPNISPADRLIEQEWKRLNRESAALFRAQDYVGAINTASQALKILEKTESPYKYDMASKNYRILGDSYRKMGDKKKALVHLQDARHAIEMVPGNSETMYFLDLDLTSLYRDLGQEEMVRIQERYANELRKKLVLPPDDAPSKAVGG